MTDSTDRGRETSLFLYVLPYRTYHGWDVCRDAIKNYGAPTARFWPEQPHRNRETGKHQAPLSNTVVGTQYYCCC